MLSADGKDSIVSHVVDIVSKVRLVPFSEGTDGGRGESRFRVFGKVGRVCASVMAQREIVKFLFYVGLLIYRKRGLAFLFQGMKQA